MLNYLRRYTRIDYRFVLRTVLISRKPKDTIRLPDICFLGNETYRTPIALSAQVYVQGQRDVDFRNSETQRGLPSERALYLHLAEPLRRTAFHHSLP